MEVAEQHHYVFDQDDFNFVAIRDRIRCYYKSYVQTARKRGVAIPNVRPPKKQKVAQEAKESTETKEEEQEDTEEQRDDANDEKDQEMPGEGEDAAAKESP